MKINTLKLKLRMKAVLLFFALFFSFSFGHINFMGGNLCAQQVLLDSHSAANGSPNWTITTHYTNELIIISAGGYGVGGNTLNTSPGTITVNGNNATYITRGEWLDFNFTWVCAIWAYVAPTPGTYNLSCTENTLQNPFYFNFASSVYQPNCPIGLNLGDIVIGGNDSNHGPTTISASITTTENGSWIYGTVDNNDNGATGVVAWNGQLTELDHTYISDGVDGAQADSTYANAGTYNITSTDIGASNVWMTIALIAVQPNESCCALTATAKVLSNVSCFGGSNGSAYGIPANGHSPYTYSWAPGGQTTDTITGLSAGTYTITISDTISCSATATVTIKQPAAALSCTLNTFNIKCNGGVGSATAAGAGGTSPYTYSWTPGGESTASATGLSAGTYVVNVTDSAGCTTSASTTITEPGAMSVTVSGPSIICTGSSGTLTANVSGGTSPYSSYVWTPGNLNGSSITISPASAQTYTVVVTDANGCTASGQIAVATGPSMSVSISGAHSICAGLSTTLCASVNGGTGGNQYTWLPGNLTTPCITVSPNSTTTYSLQVTDNCSTEASATATLRVNPLPATAFTTNLSTGCAPLCIQFYNTTTLSQGSSATYLWTFGNGDSSTAQNPINCYPSSGRYSVNLTVISDSGCSSTLSKVGMITAYAKPAGAFTFSPETPTMLNPTVQFADNSYDQYSIVYWLWNFGDGSDSASNSKDPSHTYQDTGSYCVTMMEMDEHGCTDTVTNCLVVEPQFNLYIPSAFTPNGDSKNPTFEPKGDYIKSFEMYIFDRWGMQLYHTTDINKGWDGSVGSSGTAQEDTYVYKILVTDSEGKQHTYIGNVTLLK